MEANDEPRMWKRQGMEQLVRLASLGVCEGCARQRRRDVLAQHSGIASLSTVRPSGFTVKTLLCTVSFGNHLVLFPDMNKSSKIFLRSYLVAREILIT